MNHDILVGHGGIQSEILQRNNLYQVIQAVTFLSPIWRSPPTIDFGSRFHSPSPKKSQRTTWYLKQGGNLFDLISHEAHKQLHVESSSTRNGMILGAGNQSQKVPLSPSRKKGNNLDLEVFLSNPPKSNFWYKVFGVFLKLCD